jgi:hypothetical protein
MERHRRPWKRANFVVNQGPTMSEQTDTPDVTPQAVASDPAPAKAAQKPARRPVTDPREVASVVLGRMQLVKAKKDELSLAIDALVDITHQLTRVYAQQLMTIEVLRRRVKELEGPAAAMPSQPPATLQ